MPPKASVVAPPSPSPPPPMDNDAQDILIVQDIMDTLDQIPPELTRVFSDLNELGAVLYSTLMGLETKLYQLINWIQDPSIKPEQRFELLQEIAEEAARYKLGGDDKIRVAGGACDGILGHQRHISNLLAASTLLNPSPPSPYTQNLTLPFAQPIVNSRRLQRAANSPSRQFGAKEAALANENRVGDTPTKKKKGRVGQLGNKDDDETSSVGGEKKEKKTTKKRKPVNRAFSPTESVASTSAFTGKTAEPRTARQLAAAASKARKAEQDDNSDEDSKDEGGKTNGVSASGAGASAGPGAGGSSSKNTNPPNDWGYKSDYGTAEKEPVPRSNNNTPSGNGGSRGGNGTGGGGGSGRAKTGIKRSRGDEDDDDDSEMDEENGKPAPKRTSSTKKSVLPVAFNHDIHSDPPVVVDEIDSKTYCTCGQVSYGEMIGCDDDNCEIEWYHLACLDLDKTPEGNWICPRCVERKKKQPKSKKANKAKVRK